MRRLAFAGFMLVLAACFAALSYWQVQRLHWKEALIARLEAAQRAEPVTLSGADIVSIATSAEPAVKRGTLHGTLNECRAVTLINQLRDGQRGEAYLAPLMTPEGPVYVSLGWSPSTEGPARAYKSDHCQEARDATVTGLLTRPHWNSYMPEGELGPDLWARADTVAMGEKAGLKDVKPVLLLADEALVPGALPAAQSLELPRNAHLQYALFWGAMAVMVGLLTLYVVRRKSL